ncbi:hypothetical protein [Streptomyces sp. NPDC010273]|uniref:hypothetical protein n=1 Tax=Streptomyces sp. NPDC010273 TaxID=3364829 RepID=UPI0036E244BF
MFASQADALGLTTGQAKELQGRVDGYLSELGGRQVAVNKIDLGGATVLLSLPGEKTARDVSANSQPGLVCPEYTFCAWSQRFFTGDLYEMYQCRTWNIPWVNRGSWMNNQTTGTIAFFMDEQKISRWNDRGALDQDEDADWSWVWYVHNC